MLVRRNYATDGYRIMRDLQRRDTKGRRSTFAKARYCAEAANDLEALCGLMINRAAQEIEKGNFMPKPEMMP